MAPAACDCLHCNSDCIVVHHPSTIVAVAVAVTVVFIRQFSLYYNQDNQVPRGYSSGSLATEKVYAKRHVTAAQQRLFGFGYVAHGGAFAWIFCGLNTLG